MRQVKTSMRMALTTALVAVLAFGLIGEADAASKAAW
jgi:hypothetical protein